MNIQRELFNKIYKDTDGKDISFDEFSSRYRGELMFIYYDRFGLPIELIKETMYGY